jgi:hypothetical protein
LGSQKFLIWSLYDAKPLRKEPDFCNILIGNRQKVCKLV